ncbi:MAG: hypothetical protein JRF30_03270 [Deltaproteobacteria bacterium]|jgi:hypothetical protein|nr:hypothetical protein [Deltaproteobacteria bacterium]MBW1794564.1 hypothetical protein [Deltaproteobacteria bacterium]MBW2329957.1 hypothetical protein [Deltaproteobacteria bacterium]
MLNIIFGLCLLCAGIFGIMRNWWAVVDFVRVVIPVAVVIFGVLSILAGLSGRRERSK